MLWSQFRSPILILLIVTAGVSLFLGESTNSTIIGVILAASVGLGFGNEFQAERAAEALHSRVMHSVVALRDGAERQIGVVELVPGGIVRLALGVVIRADVRLLAGGGLLYDESILTGESLPAGKNPAPVKGDAAPGDLACCLFTGSIVQAGSGSGVVAKDGRAEFGRIALGVGWRQPQTEFQLGLRRFPACFFRWPWS